VRQRNRSGLVVVAVHLRPMRSSWQDYVTAPSCRERYGPGPMKDNTSLPGAVCRLAWSMKLLERCMAYMAGVAARSQDASISRMRSPVGRPEKAALSTAVLNGQNLDPSGMVGLYPLTALSQVASMTGHGLLHHNAYNLRARLRVILLSLQCLLVAANHLLQDFAVVTPGRSEPTVASDNARRRSPCAGYPIAV
jgi:hypothetical protein